MTARCEPADPSVDGWHWLSDRAGFLQCWQWRNGMWLIDNGPRDAETTHSIGGYRYIAPFPSPEQVAAREVWRHGQSAENTYDRIRNNDLRAALAPFSKEPDNG